MKVVELCDDEQTYWIRADSIEDAKQYYVENLALDFETEMNAESLTARILDDSELDTMKVYDEDDPGVERTFRESILADLDLPVPYCIAQTE